MALARSFDLVRLSLNFDTLTVYYKFETEVDQGIRACHEKFINDGKINKCSINLKNDVDRYVRRYDDDHDFYHQDAFSIDENHSHWKFRDPILRANLIYILNVFTQMQLLTSQESKNFLDAYDIVCKETFTDLRISLSGTRDKQIDTREIVNFVKNCSNNNILAFLHQSLLGQRFDYLRENTAFSANAIWQGTDAQHNIIETSKEWAHIEKAISLQMARNIKDHVSNFTLSLSRERAKQLDQNFSFFSIKRKVLIAGKQNSGSFKAFADADSFNFDVKYDKHFNRYVK